MVHTTEPIPGQYDIRCTITFGQGSPPNPGDPPPPIPAPLVVTSSVTILTPNGAIKSDGFGEWTDVSSSRTIIYRITCNNKLSAGNAGTAQERITSIIEYLDPNDPSKGHVLETSQDWKPGVASPLFFLNGAFIEDVVSQSGIEPDFANVEVGRIFLKWTQELRLVLFEHPNCIDDQGFPIPTKYPLGAFNLQKRKVSANQYVIESQ